MDLNEKEEDEAEIRRAIGLDGESWPEPAVESAGSHQAVCSHVKNIQEECYSAV